MLELRLQRWGSVSPLQCTDPTLVLLNAGCPGWPEQSQPARNGEPGSWGCLSVGRGQSRALPALAQQEGADRTQGVSEIVPLEGVILRVFNYLKVVIR